jgi:tetratricopeptide (TPR) repeat protein
VIAAVLAAALALGADPATRFAEATERHAAGDHAGAARGYEALLADDLESPALHVNLGTLLLQEGRRGAAIASFARALRLDPRDDDARERLSVARGRSGGRLGGESPFLARIVERTPDAWAAAALAVSWTALWLLLALRRRSSGRGRALLGGAAVAAALCAAAGGALVAGRAAERERAVAVVIARAAPLRDGPEEALRPTLELEEGTEVRILETRGRAARVRLPSRVEGWVPAGDLERL